jgi:hypothetical protein
MSRMRARLAQLLVLLPVALSCSDEGGNETSTATGGNASGGSMSVGGSTGGVNVTGGAASGGTTGGVTSTGGMPASGGTSGGTTSTGGTKATGGTPSLAGAGSGGKSSGGSPQTTGGSSLGGGGTGGGSAGMPAAGSTARTLSFEADIWPVFALIRDPIFEYYDGSTYESCVTAGVCHGGTSPGAGLRMPDPSTAYEQLLNVPSRTSLCDDTLRVVPGDPDQSCLILFYLQRLQTELEWVNDAEIDLVREWITQGAAP